MPLTRLTDKICPKCGSNVLCQFEHWDPGALYGDDESNFTHKCSNEKCNYQTSGFGSFGQYTCFCGYDWYKEWTSHIEENKE